MRLRHVWLESAQERPWKPGVLIPGSALRARERGLSGRALPVCWRRVCIGIVYWSCVRPGSACPDPSCVCGERYQPSCVWRSRVCRRQVCLIKYGILGVQRQDGNGEWCPLSVTWGVFTSVVAAFDEPRRLQHVYVFVRSFKKPTDQLCYAKSVGCLLTNHGRHFERPRVGTVWPRLWESRHLIGRKEVIGGHCVCGQNDEDFVSDVVKQFCDALTSQCFAAKELSFWFKVWDRTGDCWKLSMSVAVGKWTVLSSKFVVYMGLVIWSSLVQRLCQPESFRCWLMLVWD